MSGDEAVEPDGAGETSLRDALASRYEIARPSHETLVHIARHGGHEELRELLKDTRTEDLKRWLWGRQLVDVLHEYPLKAVPADFCGVLRKLQPRLYSIASSPHVHPNEIHLTVAIVRYANANRRSVRKGVASTFLADRAGAEVNVPVFLQKSGHFHLPKQGDTPIIMVGPGTGVAPFRGFLHERRARGDRGHNWLFFGEQHSASDFYYRDELEEFRHDGFLTRLDLAFSRDQEQKIYVQDRMRQQGRELWNWLEAGAVFYVCGDASRMAKDVDMALKTVVAKHGGMSAGKALEYVTTMTREKRYLRDVY